MCFSCFVYWDGLKIWKQETIILHEVFSCILIYKLFAVYVCAKGLNFYEHFWKKQSFIDFILCVPKMLDSVLKMKHIVESFAEASMIDKETKVFQVFDKLMCTCTRWVSSLKDIGIQKTEKKDWESQFQSFMKLEFAHTQITYWDMKGVATH